MNLMRVELRRLLWRRLLKGLVAAFLAMTALSAVAMYIDSRPLSAEQEAQIDESYNSYLQQWKENEFIPCMTDPGGKLSTDPQREAQCRRSQMPRAAYGGKPIRHVDEFLQGSTQALGLLLCLLTFVLGAGFVAAEFATGSMGTLLTFEPRRLRVLAAKFAAVAIVVLPLAILAVGLMWGIAAGVTALNGTFDPTPAPTLNGYEPEGYSPGIVPTVDDLRWVGARLVLLATGAGLAGSALGTITRNTAAAIGLVIGYAAVVESILGSLIEQRLVPWLFRTNVEAALNGKAVYWTNTCTSGTGGPYGGFESSCQSIEHVVTQAHGIVYLLVALVAVTAVAAYTFRRRDVP